MSKLVPGVAAVLWVTFELARHARVRSALRRASSPRGAADVRVALLTAVRGGDPGLTEVLAESLATLAGAGHVLHWLLDEDDALGRAAARDAAARYPALSVNLMLCPPCPPGINPKLFKLERAWHTLASEIVVVLDDDACLPLASLDALVHTVAAGEAELATALPVYHPGSNLPARLLAAFVDDNAAPTYLGWCARRPALTLNGMAYALRRETLRDLGGFAALLAQLTDDLAVGSAVRARGGRIAQLPVPVWMRTELRDLRAWAAQMHRWMLFARLLYEEQPPRVRRALAGEQGLAGVLPVFVLALSCASFTRLAGALFGLAFLMQLLLRRDARARVAGRAAPFTPWCSLVAALTQPAFLAWAALDRTIRWRDRRYRVHTNTCFEPAGR